MILLSAAKGRGEGSQQENETLDLGVFVKSI